MKKWIKAIRKRYEDRVVKRNEHRRAVRLARQRLGEIMRFEVKADAKEVVDGLTATNFRPTGTHFLERSAIVTLSNQDTMIWIQCGLVDGRLKKVFREVNQNDLAALVAEITTPDQYRQQAIDKLQRVHRFVAGAYNRETGNVREFSPLDIDSITNDVANAVADIRQIKSI